MKEIHFIKAGHAYPFVSLLSAENVAVRKLADQAGLPLDTVLEGNGVIGERSLWRFVDLAAHKLHRDFLGYEAATATPVFSGGKLGVMPIAEAPSLKGLLDQFFIEAMAESTGCVYALELGKTHSKLRRTPTFGNAMSSWQVEQYMIQVFIQIIRIVTGPCWLPAEVGVCSVSSPQPLPREWLHIRFKWGQSCTELLLPNSILDLPPLSEFRYPDQLKRYGALNQPVELSIGELILRQTKAGCPGIEAAARELGMSCSTLKRRLNDMGVTYSALIEESRFRLAKEMLEIPTIPLKQIAHDLGYSHRANFDRAFKRWSGVSPRQYRTNTQ